MSGANGHNGHIQPTPLADIAAALDQGEPAGEPAPYGLHDAGVPVLSTAWAVPPIAGTPLFEQPWDRLIRRVRTSATAYSASTPATYEPNGTPDLDTYVRSLGVPDRAEGPYAPPTARTWPSEVLALDKPLSTLAAQYQTAWAALRSLHGELVAAVTVARAGFQVTADDPRVQALLTGNGKPTASKTSAARVQTVGAQFQMAVEALEEQARVVVFALAELDGRADARLAQCRAQLMEPLASDWRRDVDVMDAGDGEYEQLVAAASAVRDAKRTAARRSSGVLAWLVAGGADNDLTEHLLHTARGEVSAPPPKPPAAPPTSDGRLQVRDADDAAVAQAKREADALARGRAMIGPKIDEDFSA
jgi:hypothetical protein